MSDQERLGELARAKKFGGYVQGMWVPPWKCERFPHLFARSCIVSTSGNTRIPHVCREPLGHRDQGTPHECVCKHRWMDGQLRRIRRRLHRGHEPSWWQQLIEAWKNRKA